MVLCHMGRILLNFSTLSFAVMLFSLAQYGLSAEQADRASQNQFRWVNPFPEDFEPLLGLYHKTFLSPSMQKEVGYAIYLPPHYLEDDNRFFPVVYYLHGGRPGNETRSTYIVNSLHEAMSSGATPSVIYIFVNGGEISHWNYPPLASMGEDVFVKELIPYTDSNYRTVADRSGRAIQGFSQGGRGATRIAFKYPDLFSSVVAGGGAYQVERQIAENNGIEYDTRRRNPQRLDFGIGNDAYSLAQSYAVSNSDNLEIAFWGGTEGFNYEGILVYMEYLDSLDVGYQSYFVGGIGHNAMQLYQAIGLDLMNFHANVFETSVNE